MEFFRKLYDLLRHLGEDARWQAMIEHVGVGNLYAVLFLIVFAETGLVVTPFLPGDSLLFALGALGARPGIEINLPLATVLLIVAAILGDAVNYWIGYKVGPAVFREEDDEPRAAGPAESGGRIGYDTPPPKPRSLRSRLLNKKHLLRAQAFYEAYGGKTIILARFVPIVRTFAPFVAGVGRMNFFRFWLYNVTGAVAWVVICVGAGRLFGDLPFVKKHFELVIVAIVVISVLPMAVEFWKARRDARRGAGDPLLQATTLGEDPSAPPAAEPDDNK